MTLHQECNHILQEDIPTYSIIDITDTTFTINTYRTDTNEKIDTQFTIVKENKAESDLTDEQKKLDIDGDGKITSADSFIILQYVVGLK